LFFLRQLSRQYNELEPTAVQALISEKYRQKWMKYLTNLDYHELESFNCMIPTLLALFGADKKKISESAISVPIVGQWFRPRRVSGGFILARGRGWVVDG
jgi:hypothetical protein